MDSIEVEALGGVVLFSFLSFARALPFANLVNTMEVFPGLSSTGPSVTWRGLSSSMHDNLVVTPTLNSVEVRHASELGSGDGGRGAAVIATDFETLKLSAEQVSEASLCLSWSLQ